MTETPGVYNVSTSIPCRKFTLGSGVPTFEAQLKALPPAVRDMEGVSMTELPAWALLYPVVNLPQGQVRYMMQSL
jgi:hypothetical protein